MLDVALESEGLEVSRGHVTQRSRDNDVTRLFRLMGKNTLWVQQQSVTMQGWQTFHTQGMVKIDSVFIVSAVEIIEDTQRNGAHTDALYDHSLDRSPGCGRAWVFKFDALGRLLDRLELTDGSAYHPGGIDYDGRHVWVPVAEYRPNSRSHVFRIDPQTMTAQRVLSVRDHIGAIVHNVHRGTLHGVSWGSRRLHTWQRSPSHGGWIGHWVPNSDGFVDYQDCHYHGIEYMLCGGVSRYETPRGPIAFGGMSLVDLRNMQPTHLIPINHFIDEGDGPNPGLALSHNAFWFEAASEWAVRAYFMAESNNQAQLLVFEATPWSHRRTT